MHLLRGGHLHAARSRWHRQRRRGDEGDLRPTGGGLLGEGVPLLARGAVADEAHGVDGLARAAGGDEHAQPGQVGAADGSPEQHLGHGRDDRAGLGQPAGADVAAGEATVLGRHDVHAPGASMSRLSCTAGCSHISVCIAGQTITGARVASSTLVSRSFEYPDA